MSVHQGNKGTWYFRCECGRVEVLGSKAQAEAAEALHVLGHENN